MKTLLTFLFLIFSNLAFCQTFAPVGSVWNYISSTSVMDCPVGSCITGPFTIKVVGDTIVDNVPGSVLHYSEHLVTWGGSPEYNNHGLYGYLFQRNDSIFFSSNGILKDSRFIYSFQLKAKDSILLACTKIVIDSVKVETISGQQRKVLYLKHSDKCSSWWKSERMIEEVGPINELLNWNDLCFCPEYGTYYSFSCFKKGDGTFDYPESNSYCITLNTVNENSLNVSIYPNPVSDILSIDLGKNSIELIEIYNVKGIKVKIVKEVNTGLIELNVSHLLKGIYLIRILDKDGKYLNKTVVID